MKDTIKDQFLAVYEASADGIFRFCLFRVFDREKARDLTQEAFMRTWRVLSAGKEIENLKAFVYKVARNLIIDDSRKKKEISLEQLLENNANLPISFEENMANKVDGKMILSTLEQLEPHYREVIILRFVEELTPSEIATVLGETPNAVSLRLNRAIKELRKLVNYD